MTIIGLLVRITVGRLDNVTNNIDELRRLGLNIIEPSSTLKNNTSPILINIMPETANGWNNN